MLEKGCEAWGGCGAREAGDVGRVRSVRGRSGVEVGARGGGSADVGPGGKYERAAATADSIDAVADADP